ncbi:MAG: hypothetical protein PF503_06325 [Desulfobacula sp.]|jgi:hypothetical protein|nr:hypothetical protein [Desulfobacula sp.]
MGEHEAYIHTKSKEVFLIIKNTLLRLQGSKRKADLEYKDGKVDVIIKKNYGGDGQVVYLVFLVKEEDIECFAQSWEVKGRFSEVGQDLFYFIKSQMLLSTLSQWLIIPMRIVHSIECKYAKSNSQLDFFFHPDDGQGAQPT